MVELSQLENGNGEERAENSVATFTRDGSVDRHGKVAVKQRSGGWRCGMLLLGTLL